MVGFPFFFMLVKEGLGTRMNDSLKVLISDSFKGPIRTPPPTRTRMVIAIPLDAFEMISPL